MSTEICLAWKNLRYEVSNNRWDIFKRTKKPILQQLNGFVQFHQLTSLMGPSGAGKTTLLNCIIGSATSGLCDHTQLLVNSRFAVQSLNLCYIEQHVHECIEGRLTVRQIFQYAYQFKNGLSQFGDRSQTMHRHIVQVAKQLMLHESILDQRFDQCSGGEQKRIAIGQELMAEEDRQP